MPWAISSPLDSSTSLSIPDVIQKHPPWSTPTRTASSPRFSGNMLVAQSISMAVTSHQNVTPSLAARLNTGMHIEVREPTHGERLQFEAIIRISRNFVVIRPENGYFSSFADAQQKIGIVDAMLNAALVANNPGYRNDEISRSFLTSLWSILGHMYGRGPGGCIIFDNGDSACFQINIMLPGAARTLRGSAKDINGKPLEEWNSLPNKNGYGLSVSKDNPQTGWFTWTPMPGSRGGGRQSVSCSSHNGIMRCTVRPY